MKPIIVELTAEQLEQLEPAFEAAKQAAAHDEPGILAAQIFSDGMRVGFWSSAAAEAVRVALALAGVNSNRKYRKTAHDE